MELDTALKILREYPSVASLWKVDDNNYDFPEAILALMGALDDQNELKAEIDELQYILNKRAGEIERVNDIYREKFKNMVKDIESHIFEKNISVYKTSQDFIDDLKYEFGELDSVLNDII